LKALTQEEKKMMVCEPNFWARIFEARWT